LLIVVANGNTSDEVPGIAVEIYVFNTGKRWDCTRDWLRAVESTDLGTESRAPSVGKIPSEDTEHAV
jgi:hypothetical protein